MITLTYIRSNRGVWVGRSFQDRWNSVAIKDLGRELGLQLDINLCRSKGSIDRLRRTLKGLGFALRVKTQDKVIPFPSESELQLLANPYTQAENVKTHAKTA